MAYYKYKVDPQEEPTSTYEGKTNDNTLTEMSIRKKWMEEESKLLSKISENKEFKKSGMKHRVAKCLLEGSGEQHNGFSVVISNNSNDINRCIKLAGLYKGMKSSCADDHFDELVCYPLWMLKDHEQPSSEFAMKVQALLQFGTMKSKSDILKTKVEICGQLGNFLETLKKGNVLLEFGVDDFVLVGVNFSTGLVSFNLPGGKRHLGETSVEAAKRELYEETSLFLPNSAFHKKGQQSTKFIDRENMRFFLVSEADTFGIDTANCTSLVQLLPDWLPRERCRMCIHKNKVLKDIKVKVSRKGCLNCKEIICNSCFDGYDHAPSKRPAARRHKKLCF